MCTSSSHLSARLLANVCSSPGPAHEIFKTHRTAKTMAAARAAAAAGGRWAQAEDWQARRETLQALYCDKEMTLPQVKDLMEQQHGFFAT